MIAATLAIIALTVVIGLVIDRRIGALARPEELGAPKKLVGHAAGEAPQTAIRAGATQLGRLRALQRCRGCRAPLEHQPDDHVRFDNRDLLVLQFRCPRCAARRSVYVEAVRP